VVVIVLLAVCHAHCAVITVHAFSLYSSAKRDRLSADRIAQVEPARAGATERLEHDGPGSSRARRNTSANARWPRPNGPSSAALSYIIPLMSGMPPPPPPPCYPPQLGDDRLGVRMFLAIDAAF